MDSTDKKSSEPISDADKLQMGPVGSTALCPNGQGCPMLDKVLVVLLHREESLLGDIVEECNDLVGLACDQAEEVAEFLDEEA